MKYNAAEPPAIIARPKNILGNVITNIIIPNIIKYLSVKKGLLWYFYYFGQNFSV